MTYNVLNGMLNLTVPYLACFVKCEQYKFST